MNKSGLSTMEMRRRQIMRVALEDGIFTDRLSDGVCNQLLNEGWLERATPLAPRSHMRHRPAYLPTEKATHQWKDDVARKGS